MTWLAVLLASLTTTAVPPTDPGIIDLNRATLDELLAFQGIGRQYAEKIVRARPFRSRSELVERGVMPPAVYLALKHHFYVTGADGGASVATSPVLPRGMLDLNQASRAALLAVPGVGQLYADKIIAARPFVTEYELVGRRVVPLRVFERIQAYLAVAR